MLAGATLLLVAGKVPALGLRKAKSLLLMLALALAMVPLPLSAVIIANFDAGNTSDEVDGVPGMAGDGWLNAWADFGQASPATWMASDADPLLSDTGNYMTWSFLNTHETATRSRALRRAYTDTTEIDLSSRHQVDFLYRLDTTPVRTFFIADTDPTVNNASYSGTDETTWIVAASSGNMTWRFGDGGGVAGSGDPNDPVSSGVDVFEGLTYAFSLELDPANNRYRASVTNLEFDPGEHTGVASFESDWLDFNHQVGEVFGNLTFGGRIDAGSTLAHSFDSIAIIPEPSITTLAFLALLLWLAGNRRRPTGWARGPSTRNQNF